MTRRDSQFTSEGLTLRHETVLRETDLEPRQALLRVRQMRAHDAVAAADDLSDGDLDFRQSLVRVTLTGAFLPYTITGEVRAEKTADGLRVTASTSLGTLLGGLGLSLVGITAIFGWARLVASTQYWVCLGVAILATGAHILQAASALRRMTAGAAGPTLGAIRPARSDAPMMAQAAVEVGLPAKMSAYSDGSDLVIDRKWFGGGTLLLLAIAAAWDCFIVSWYLSLTPSSPSMAFWFPLLHVGVGVVLTYGAISGVVNRTSVRVGRDTVSVRTEPLPWFNDRVVKASAIKQLYAKTHVTSNGGGGSGTFALHAILHEGGSIRLVGDLESSDQALYLAERIERHLGIEDAPVEGEL